PDGDRLRRPPKPRAAAHAGGLGGAPAAQGLPDRRRARPLQRRAMSATAERSTTYEGTRIPSRVPTILDVPPELRSSPDVLQVNFGRNHPSTHGVLRLIVDLHGEEVVGVSAVVGYLQSGFEKSMESETYWKGVT